MFEARSLLCSSKDTNEPSQDKNKCITTRQRSCAFVNTPLLCINKAIHHIQELEVKMEKYFQQYYRVFKEEKMPWLNFQDANVSCKDSKTLTLKLETAALLLEVTELIKRLDADCKEAEKALEQEKQRRKTLCMKLDCMSLWRLQQLPAAVQKEYETCTQDILELQWHFDCKTRLLQQVENQVLKIETVNKTIQEDIDFMKKHSPLLEEKMNLEGEAMKDVSLAYGKASKIYSDVHCELVEIQKTMKRIDEEAEKEIKSISQKIKYAEMLFSQYNSRKKKTYQSEIKTVCRSIQKIEEQVKSVNKDLYNIEFSYSEKRTKYEDLQKKITSEKIHYKRLEVNIKKEIQDQKGIWKMTQAKIKAIYGELEEKRKERLKKREEDMKTIEETERPVADLETKFRRNKDIFKENHEKLLYLDQRVQELDKQQKQTEQQLEQRSTVVQQQLNDIQEKYSVVSSQIAENFHTTENFKNELKELNALWNMKEMQMENTEKSFIDLGKNLSAVMFKQQNVQIVFDRLQDELAEYEKRLKQEEKTYGELLQTRKKNLKDLEATLEQIIKENLWLAQEYQIFQNYYLKDKENLTELYDSRIKVEAAVRDHHQLSALQSRMRRALAEYFRQRGLHSQAGLAKFQAASHENAQKILAVQGELSKTIQHITAFLHSLTDGSSAIDNNANNQCISDAEIKDKKSHTVQITVCFCNRMREVKFRRQKK
ncbi:coiled-coil domain-containing protein 178 isoform X3 [Struthio camelus]|uniref:coiled-coil domain-containing protein 178 isoform X3 n=1 Tax=Struthio camelus TaxID=8801 RepID=UPI003603C9CD